MFAVFFFLLAFGFSLWAAGVGWKNGNLRGVEFRQAQTALSTYFIQLENNFDLAYPTPVLGKPWSVPMEFPLYEWTVAGLSNVSGLSLVSTARLVSLVCFYLTLPAIFLLLGQWQVPRSHRWLILGLIVSSPLYIFYSRAFLIETMALMMSVWFLLAYWKTITTGKWSWLLSVNIFAIAASWSKVTTFILYLVPAAVVTVMLLWKNRPDAENPSWKRAGRILALSLSALVLPFVATLWWTHFSDVVKAANPSSRFLVSSNMMGYHFGTAATRFAANVWAGHWRIFSHSVVWWPLVAISGLALIAYGRKWSAKVLFCVACFVGVQVLFPELYAWHDYYYVSNTVFLLVAMGLSVGALFDSPLPRWFCATLLAAMLGGQVYFYAREFYQMQSRISPEGSDLTRVLKAVTHPEDVLLIQGEDWNSMTPYYARRRALMLRAGVDQNETEMREAFANLKGEPIGALVITGDPGKNALLMKLVVEYFKLRPEPVLKVHDKLVYFPDERWDEVFDKVQSNFFNDVIFLPGTRLGQDSLAGHWFEVDKLKRYQLGALKYLNPKPVRFYVRFGLSLTGTEDAPQFGAHPETRLRFKIPAGTRHLKTSAGMSPGAYENLPADQATDGIDVNVTILKTGVADQVIYHRNLNPREHAADRGAVPIDVTFEMPADALLEVSVTPGPADSDRRDWTYLGKLLIE